MQGSYCQSCDFTYDGAFTACPECGAAVEVLAGDEAIYGVVDDGSKGSIGAGVGLLFLLHLIQLVFITGGVEALFFMGITQFIYVIPAAIVLAIKGRTRTLGGLLIGAGITFFLNGLVFGLLYASMF